MTDGAQCFGPVAVGGVGGSGTRLIAMFLKELGFYMGDDLNRASDNLWFSLLFARPKWFADSSKDDILEGVSIFNKAMTGHFHPQHDELGFIISAVIDMTFFEHLYWAPTPVKSAVKRIWPLKWTAQMLWATKRVLTIARSKQVDYASCTGWGWKEPCTYAYIEHLSEYFECLKYIHVIRNGLDMAYSSNQGHLIAWGGLFGVSTPDTSKLLPKASLDYWIKANETAIAQGTQLLGDRFLIIDFDRLCREPQEQIAKLVDFVELDPGYVDIDRLSDLCKVPASLDRYKKYDTEFDTEAIDAVRRLGFSVDLS